MTDRPSLTVTAILGMAWWAVVYVTSGIVGGFDDAVWIAAILGPIGGGFIGWARA